MAKKHAFWSRVFTFVPAPLSDDGEVMDEDGLRRVLDHQIDNDVDGVCVFGSTGGNGSFSEEEMMREIEVAARHVDGRISVIAGTGARTTSGCTRLSMHAEAVGCDGVMILPMTYWPLGPDEVRVHYEHVAGATGWAPVVTNFLPQDAMEFFRTAVYEENLAAARGRWDRLFPICEMICAKSHIRAGHTGLDIVGRSVGPPRRPLRMLSAEDRAVLESLLEAAGALDGIAGKTVAAQ